MAERVRKYSKNLLALLVLCAIGADFDSGSGIFGKWIKDRYGLVAYQYEMDQRTDPRAKWQRGKDTSTLHWHQLGNIRINAIADNDGFVQLFYNDSAQVWLNSSDLAGGYGMVADGNTAFLTLYPRLPKGATMKRIFGQGYFEKETDFDGLSVDEIIFAPTGDISALVMRVELKNDSAARRKISYLPRFNVSPLVLIPFATKSADKAASARIKYTVEKYPEKMLTIWRSQKVWGRDGGYPNRVMSRDPDPRTCSSKIPRRTRLSLTPAKQK